MFIVTPHYDAKFDKREAVDVSEMWLTVDENGEYIIHFWDNGEQKEQVVGIDMIATMKEYMEVREE